MTIAERLEEAKGMLDGGQVAEMLALHPVTIRKWVSAEKIPHVRIGGRVKFDPGALPGGWVSGRWGDPPCVATRLKRNSRTPA
jgi:excisionase family DNA binding protein